MEKVFADPPIPVASRSKACVFGRSLARVAGSNLAGGMDVFLLLVLFVVRYFCFGLVLLPQESYRLLCA